MGKEHIRITAGAYIAGKSAEKALENSNEYSLLPSETALEVKQVISEIIKNSK